MKKGKSPLMKREDQPGKESVLREKHGVRAAGREDRQMDMRQGPIAGRMVLFALPLALSSILQQFFNSADVAVVGHFAGSLPLAAVGANVANVGIFVNFIVGASVGPNVLIARLIGQGRREETSRAVHSTVWFSVLAGLLLMFLGEAAAPALLRATATPEHVFSLALTYLRIYLLGVPFMVIYNFGAGALRSWGETRIPLLCMVISGTVNVVLNLVFVIGLSLDVTGVALATSISNALAAVIVLLALCRAPEPYRLHRRLLRPDRNCIRKIVSIGLPSGIQMAVFSVSNLFVQSGVNSFGPDAIAGSSAALNFEYFAYDLAVAFAQAAITFYAQNLGAGQLDRCRRIYHLAMLLGIGTAEALSLILLLGGNLFVRFYTPDAAVIAFALRRMRHVLSLEGFTATYEITAGVLRSRGRSITPALITIFGTVVLRWLWVVTVFARIPDFGVLMNVYPVTWFITFALLYIAYRRSITQKRPALARA